MFDSAIQPKEGHGLDHQGQPHPTIVQKKHGHVGKVKKKYPAMESKNAVSFRLSLKLIQEDLHTRHLEDNERQREPAHKVPRPKAVGSLQEIKGLGQFEKGPCLPNLFLFFNRTKEEEGN